MTEDEKAELAKNNLGLLVKAMQLAMKQEADGKPMVERLAVSEDRVRILVDDRLDEKLEPLVRRIDTFLSSSDIERRIEHAFAEAALPIDKDHKDKTAEAMRVYMWSFKIGSRLGLGVLMAVLTAAVGAILKFFGFNINLSGGAG